MHGWHEINLHDVYAVSRRIWWTKSLGMILNRIHWEAIRAKDCKRYKQMLTDIERDWDFYPYAQKMHDAIELCYLLSGGHDVTLSTKEKREARILELTKIYYRMEDKEDV